MPYHLAACNKDEPISCGERTPKKEPTDKFKVVWNILIDNEISINEIFIGNKYLGVPDWPCNGHPPHIFPGGTFPQSAFATSFDREMTNDNHPINVYTDFSEPYIATIEYPNGIAYMQFLKDILESDECRKCKGHIPKLHKFRVEQTKEVSNIKLFFPDNERLGETIEQIVN